MRSQGERDPPYSLQHLPGGRAGNLWQMGQIAAQMP